MSLRFVSSLVLAVLFVSPCPLALAAELQWDPAAALACDGREPVLREVAALLGRPLADELDWSFHVEVQKGEADALTVAVSSEHAGDGEPSRSRRELVAATCREAIDAAAVAIAMTITGASAPPQRVGTPELAPAPAPEEPAAMPTVPWQAWLGLAVALDSGALPRVGWGAEGRVSAQRKAVRISLYGSYFARQDALLRGEDRGGEFSLLLGGLLGCGQHTLGPVTLRGCGGAELGSLRARGIGLARPRTDHGFWRAARVEAGAGYALSDRLSAVLQAGMTVPLGRPEFTVAGDERVYRVAPLTVRALLGLEIRLDR